MLDLLWSFTPLEKTFSTDRGLIASYVGDDYLDGQFDFSIYFKLTETLAREEGPLYALEDEYFYSQEAYQGALMSNFLGNHDVGTLHFTCCRRGL